MMHAEAAMDTSSLAGEARLARAVDEDPSPNVLEPWIVLPSQLADGGRVQLSGETRLMAAILADAIQLYLKHRRSPTANGQILFRETESWILSRDHRWLLSFENICDALHIHAGNLRRTLCTNPPPDLKALPVDTGRLRVARGRKIRV